MTECCHLKCLIADIEINQPTLKSIRSKNRNVIKPFLFDWLLFIIAIVFTVRVIFKFQLATSLSWKIMMITVLIFHSLTDQFCSLSAYRRDLFVPKVSESDAFYPSSRPTPPLDRPRTLLVPVFHSSATLLAPTPERLAAPAGTLTITMPSYANLIHILHHDFSLSANEGEVYF